MLQGGEIKEKEEKEEERCDKEGRGHSHEDCFKQENKKEEKE